MEREEEVSLRIRQASITKNGRTAVDVGRTLGFIDPLSLVDCFIVFWVLIHEWSDVRPGRDAESQCYFLCWVYYCCLGMSSPHPPEVLSWDSK